MARHQNQSPNGDRLVGDSRRLIEVIRIADADPTFAASMTLPSGFDPLEGIFDGLDPCGMAMNAVDDADDEALEALASYATCMGAKMAADFTGEAHDGCELAAINMRAATRNLEVALDNAARVCKTITQGW